MNFEGYFPKIIDVTNHKYVKIIMDNTKTEEEFIIENSNCDNKEDRNEKSEMLSKNQQKKLDRYLAVSGI